MNNSKIRKKVDADSYLSSGSNELRVLEYRVAGMSFGINILKVSKIANKLTDLIDIPESHHAVRGCFRDIDRLVPILDLARFFGLEDNNTIRENVIVTEFFGILTGFWVERVDWIHHFRWEDVIDAKHVMKNIDQRYVIGIVKPTEERMVLLLDYETILLDVCPSLRSREAVTYKTDTDFSGKRILIAEDSPAVRAMLVNEMTELGFEVISASDGKAAWDEFEKKPFDLVISDVEMPQMDGLALVLKIRQSSQPDTPVIVYSSIGDVGMKARAEFLKVDAHITKLHLDQVIQTVDKLMKGEPVPHDQLGDPDELVETPDQLVPV